MYIQFYHISIWKWFAFLCKNPNYFPVSKVMSSYNVKISHKNFLEHLILFSGKEICFFNHWKRTYENYDFANVSINTINFIIFKICFLICYRTLKSPLLRKFSIQVLLVSCFSSCSRKCASLCISTWLCIGSMRSF